MISFKIPAAIPSVKICSDFPPLIAAAAIGRAILNASMLSSVKLDPLDTF